MRKPYIDKDGNVTFKKIPYISVMSKKEFELLEDDERELVQNSLDENGDRSESFFNHALHEMKENGVSSLTKLLSKKFETDEELTESSINHFIDSLEGESGVVYFYDRLRHNVPSIDENGDIKGYYTEIIMSAHHREIQEHYEVSGKILDGTDIIHATRIPAQDKHSAVFAKVVDLLPAYRGSDVVTAREIIKISGASFAGDKLYCHRFAGYFKNSIFYKYGEIRENSLSFTEQFFEYAATLTKEFAREVHKLKKQNLQHLNKSESFSHFFEAILAVSKNQEFNRNVEGFTSKGFELIREYHLYAGRIRDFIKTTQHLHSTTLQFWDTFDDFIIKLNRIKKNYDHDLVRAENKEIYKTHGIELLKKYGYIDKNEQLSM